MPKRDVIIEGSRDTSRPAVGRLAELVAERYGLSLGAVASALSQGKRIRVRIGADDDTATRFKTELEAMGARVSLLPTLPAGAPAPSVAAPSLAPPAVASASVPAAIPDAFSGAASGLTLSMLDGGDEDPRPSAGPASPSPGLTSPSNRFLPPSPAEPELQLVSMPQRRHTLSDQTTATPSGSARVPRPSGSMSAPSARVSAPAPEVLSAPGSAPPDHAHAPQGDLAEPHRAKLRIPSLGDPRFRLAVGLGLGLLGGLIPAHIYGLFAEDKLDAIRSELVSQPPPQTEVEYDLVLHQFTLAHDRMIRVRNRIAIVAGFLWLVAGGAVSFAFWRFAPERRS